VFDSANAERAQSTSAGGDADFSFTSLSRDVSHGTVPGHVSGHSPPVVSVCWVSVAGRLGAHQPLG